MFRGLGQGFFLRNGFPNLQHCSKPDFPEEGNTLLNASGCGSQVLKVAVSITFQTLTPKFDKPQPLNPQP